MTKFTPRSRPIRLTDKSHSDFNLISDAIPLLIKKGSYQALWQSPQFLQTNQLSQHIIKSAALLKKHLPLRFHQHLRFSQSPNTWVLSVNHKDTTKQVADILGNLYQSNATEDTLPPFLTLRHVYRHWEKKGERLADMTSTAPDNPIEQLQHAIPSQLHPHIRLQYQASIWQLNAPNAAIATSLNPLLDELSLLIAKDMGFAPKLKLSVIPDNWKTSGFMLVELVKERPKTPTEAEAEAFLNDFLRSTTKD